MTATPPNMDRRPTRRDFLRLARDGLLAASGLLALGALAHFFGYRPEAVRPTTFDLRPAASYPPGSHTVLAEAQAVLLHTEQGFRALSLVCPHLGCQVQPAADGFACPCHGSRFDAQGSLLRGPADRSLRSLRLEEIDGRLVLHTD